MPAEIEVKTAPSATQPQVESIPVDSPAIKPNDQNVEVPPATSPDAFKVDDFDEFKPENIQKSQIPKTSKPTAEAKDRQKQVTGEEVEDDQEGEETVEVKDEVPETDELDEKSEAGEGDLKDENEKPESDKIHGNSTRNYEGFTKEEVKLLKKLDRPRFEVISKEWRQLKSLAGESVRLAKELETKDTLLKTNGIPPQWHEHPEAYILSKDYQTISQQYQQQNLLEDAHRQALRAIKSGEPWRFIRGLDQQGQPVWSEPQEATTDSELWVTEQLQKATFNKNGLQAKAENLKTNFQKYHQDAVAQTKGVVDKFLGQLTNKNLLPTEDDEKEFESFLGQTERNHHLAYAAKKMWGVMKAQARELLKNNSTQVQQQKIEQDRKLAGADPRKKAALPSNGKVPAKKGLLSIEEFMPKDE